MAKRELEFVKFRDPISAPPHFSGENTMSNSKHKNSKLWLGVEPGILTILHKDADGTVHEIPVPLANVASAVYKQVNDK